MARQPTFAVHISLTVSLKNVYSDLAERSLEQCDNKVLGSHTACSSLLKALINLNFAGIDAYLSTRILFIPYKTNTIG